MHDWQGKVIGHAAMAELLVQNLLLEGTLIACEEAAQASRHLYEFLVELEHCVAREDDMKQGRSLKVCETGDRYDIQHGGKRNSVPMIRLRGKWLRQAGFSAGQDVTIIVERGRLVLLTTEDSIKTEA